VGTVLENVMSKANSHFLKWGERKNI